MQCGARCIKASHATMDPRNKQHPYTQQNHSQIKQNRTQMHDTVSCAAISTCLLFNLV